MNLRSRIVLTILSIIIIAGTLLSVVNIYNTNNIVERDQLTWGKSLSQAIGKAILSDTIDANTYNVRDILRRIKDGNNTIKYLLVVGFTNNYIASTFDSKIPEILSNIDHSRCVDTDDKLAVTHVNNTDVHDIVFHMVNNLPAHIHVGIDHKPYENLIQNQKWQIVVILFIFSIIGIGTAIVIGKRLAKPLSELSTMVSDFGRGHLKEVVPIKSNDPDINNLYQSFSNMVKDRDASDTKLQKTLHSLDILNTELEQRVASRTEELRGAKEQAEQASQAKTEFLSRMSHELRTPMNAILGFSQLLQYDDDNLSEEQLENINEISKAGKHLLELINEVLDLARIESGRTQLSLEAVDPAELLGECIVMIQPMADQKDISILNHVTQSEHAITADRLRLKQTLLNLLSNAIKYNKPSGNVTIDMETLDHETCRVSITDQGDGIPKELHHRLFKPFDRLDADNTNIEGTGIGLALSQRLVESMGGKLGVESTVGTGSTFYLELPLTTMLVQAKPKQSKAEKKEVIKSNKYKVLYVEDNPVNVRLVSKLLQRRPMIELMCAPNGQLGIDLAETHDFDLILLDIHLSNNEDGYAVLQRLRVNPKHLSIPIVALSAHAMSKDIEKGLAAGFDDYIAKPINVGTFLTTIDNYLVNKDYFA